MQRIDGYIDLCEILDIPYKNYLDTPEGYDLLYDLLRSKEDVNITKYHPGSLLSFSFAWNHQTFYFKFNSNISSYNELIMEEVLQDLGFVHPVYDLAALGNIKGVVSANYRVVSATYVSGYDVLKDAFFDEAKKLVMCFSKTSFDKHKLLDPFNNLEDIWYALEHRYQNREDKEEIVRHLMQKFVDMFLFSCLTSQSDYQFDNWSIIEYEDGTADLEFCCDNDRCMVGDPKILFLSLFVSHSQNVFCRYGIVCNATLGENLLRFHKISPREDIAKLKDMLFALESERLKDYFARIQNKTGVMVPASVQVENYEKFFIQKRFLKLVLEKSKILQRKKPN